MPRALPITAAIGQNQPYQRWLHVAHIASFRTSHTSDASIGKANTPTGGTARPANRDLSAEHRSARIQLFSRCLGHRKQSTSRLQDVKQYIRKRATDSRRSLQNALLEQVGPEWWLISKSNRLDAVHRLNIRVVHPVLAGASYFCR